MRGGLEEVERRFEGRFRSSEVEKLVGSLRRGCEGGSEEVGRLGGLEAWILRGLEA